MQIYSPSAECPYESIVIKIKLSPNELITVHLPVVVRPYQHTVEVFGGFFCCNDAFFIFLWVWELFSSDWVRSLSFSLIFCRNILYFGDYCRATRISSWYQFLNLLTKRSKTFVKITKKYTWAPQTMHNTPVMNILKSYFYIILF